MLIIGPLVSFIIIALIAALAFLLNGVIPLLGRSLIAIILGMILHYTPLHKKLNSKTIAFIQKYVLKFGIVLLGFDLSLQVLSGIGLKSLPWILTYMILIFIFTMMLARIMKVPKKTAFLIGSGSAICGGSAILTVAPLVEADDEDITFALSTIIISNLVSLIIFPLLGAYFGMEQAQMGLFAGLTIKDVATVVAVAFDYGAQAGEIATVVKLSRVLMIIVLVLGLTLAKSRHQHSTANKGYFWSAIPQFVIYFILVIIFVSFVPLPEAVIDSAGLLSSFSLAMALVCVGLNTNLGFVIKNGLKPVLLGELSWYAVAGLMLFGILKWF